MEIDLPLGFADAIFRRERSDDRKCVCGSQANFSDEGGFIFRNSHDSLCTDPPPLRIFPEGRGVCTQATPMINSQFRHEYSTVFLSLA